MIKRALSASEVPTLVAEHLPIWGKCIRKQRVAQNITAQALCERLSISRPTLVRMEKGKANISAALYLSALKALGVMGFAVRDMEPVLYEMERWNKRSREEFADDDYF